MDVLMLVLQDHSNFGYKYWQSLKSIGLDVEIHKGKKHPLGYANQAPLFKGLSQAKRAKVKFEIPFVAKVRGINELVKKARVVYFMGTFFISNANYENKKIVVDHGGSVYRQNLKTCNKFFNSFVDATIICDADWFGLGAKNEAYVCSCIDTNYLRSDFRGRDERVLIGHFPSGLTKGTDKILRVIRKLENDPTISEKFRYIGIPDTSREHIVPYEKQIQRMSDCDVYIEKCKLFQHGKPTGSWGNTTLEAASLGKVVVTQFVRNDVYKKEYGNITIHIANSEEEVERRLRNLISMTKDKLLIEKIKSRNWVVKNHSIKATGKRLYKKVFKRLLS